ncbi:MAG TPA: hypothetical protein VHM26_00155 [Chitinophagaceae bacterium]|nr:hypothetical protein [Chitinophagaceae bacterium]
MKKRNRWLLLLLLLLAIATGVYYYMPRKTSSPMPAHFIITDSALHINSDELIIKVWDYSAVDGDTVDILFDGKKVFETLAIQDSAVVYHTKKLSRGEHWIGVEALTEGWSPPASPHISVTSGSQSFEFDIEAYIGKPAGRKIIVD